MKRIVGLILVFVLSFVLIGCVPTTGDLPQVETPVIKTVKDNVVYWGSVDGAESYIVNIDDMYEKKTSDLSFDLSEVLTGTKNGFVKVKAKGNNITNKDSNWSESFNYEFVKDNGGNNNQETQKQKLATPIITGYSNNTVTWNAVENASGYIVKINEQTYNVYSTSYDVSFSESCNFSVQVKAVASTGDLNYSNSDWSSIQTFEYKKVGSEPITQPEWNGENCYLGYTFNILNDAEIRNESIKMNYKIIKDYNVINSRGNPIGSATESYISYITSFREYKEAKTTEFGGQDSVKFPIYCVEVGISTKFDYSKFENNESKTNSYLVLFEIISKHYQFTSSLYHEDTIKKLWEKNDNGEYKYLYDDFVYSLLNDEPSIFFEKYGTHIICSYNTGGYASASFLGDSLETLVSKNQSTKLGLNVSADAGIAGGHSEYYLNLKEENSSKNGQSTNESKFKTYGGNGMYIGNGKNLFEGANDDIINNWISSIGEPNQYMPKYSNAAILLDNGLSLKPLWELIVNNDQRSKELKEYYDSIFDTKKIKYDEENYFDFEIDMGDGTKENPYLIVTKEDLEKMRLNLNKKDVYFKLCNDLDLGDNWNPIGDKEWNKGALPENCFMGHFDGNGKTITYSISINSGYKNLKYIYSYGLFGSLENAKIENLNIITNIETVDEVGNESWDIDNDDCPHGPIAGGISGWMKNCEIKNCNVDGKISLGFEGNRDEGCTRVGGMAGFAEKTIFTGGVVKGNYYARGFNAACGGVVGTVYNNCTINVAVNAESYKAESGWVFGSSSSGSNSGSSDNKYKL